MNSLLQQIWLLADLEDAIKLWGGIILFVVYGVAQLVSGWQEQKKKAQLPKPRPVPPAEPAAAAAAPAAGKPATLEDTLRREVEDFLRRAQGQQPQQQQKRQPQPQQRPPQQRPQRPVPLAREGRENREARRPAEQPQRPTRRLVDQPPPVSQIPVLTPVLTPVEPARLAPLGSGVAQHVADHLRGTQTVVQHAQNLGADVAQADERMQEHLRDRFVHQLGALAPTTVATTQGQFAASPAAAEIRELLARPGGMRRLIVVGEILRRPEDRWER